MAGSGQSASEEKRRAREADAANEANGEAHGRGQTLPAAAPVADATRDASSKDVAPKDASSRDVVGSSKDASGKEAKDGREVKEGKEPKEARDAKRLSVAAPSTAPVPSPTPSPVVVHQASHAGSGTASAHPAAPALVIPPPSPSHPDIDNDKAPSLPPMPAAGPWRSFKEILSQLAQRIVDAQRPIRVLQAVRWDPTIEAEFVKSRFRELPRADASYYEANNLGFDPKAKANEFEEIARDIDRELGANDALGSIVLSTALEYRDVVRMLGARGTPTFFAYSRKLYGSPKDKLPDGKITVRELGHILYETLTNVDDAALGPTYERNIPAEAAAEELNRRFLAYFGDAGVRVEVDDGIVSDAAAGGDRVKVRTGAKFSQRDIDILEVHEGWVHVGTSLNGQQQTVAKWLSKGPPRVTAVQEGLAALVEIFTFRTYPRRARRLNDRVVAVDKAEDGANFIEVFEWFRTEGYEEEECFANTRRVFRGGVVEGGAPFTKDACYCKGSSSITRSFEAPCSEIART